MHDDLWPVSDTTLQCHGLYPFLAAPSRFCRSMTLYSLCVRVEQLFPLRCLAPWLWLLYDLLQSISHTASLLQWMDTQGQPDVTCTWNREESLRDVITRPTHTSTAERQAIIFKLNNIHTGMVKLIVPWKMITHMIYCF